MADAASAFFGQANEFNTSLGSVMGSWAKELVAADVQAKEANLGYFESLLVDPKGNPRPNISAKMVFMFGEGDDGKAEFDINEPLFVMADLTSFMPQTAQLTMSMNVESHATDKSSLEGSQSISGEGSAGWGPFKVSVKVSGSMSERKENTRSSDYRSKTDATLTMGRSPTPEGVQRLNDTLTGLGDIAKTMVSQEVKSKAAAYAKAHGLTAASTDTPAPAPAGGTS